MAWLRGISRPLVGAASWPRHRTFEPGWRDASAMGGHIPPGEVPRHPNGPPPPPGGAGQVSAGRKGPARRPSVPVPWPRRSHSTVRVRLTPPNITCAGSTRCRPVGAPWPNPVLTPASAFGDAATAPGVARRAWQREQLGAVLDLDRLAVAGHNVGDVAATLATQPQHPRSPALTAG